MMYFNDKYRHYVAAIFLNNAATILFTRGERLDTAIELYHKAAKLMEGVLGNHNIHIEELDISPDHTVSPSLPSGLVAEPEKLRVAFYNEPTEKAEYKCVLNCSTIYFNIGLLCIRRGRFEVAEKVLKRALHKTIKHSDLEVTKDLVIPSILNDIGCIQFVSDRLSDCCQSFFNALQKVYTIYRHEECGQENNTKLLVIFRTIVLSLYEVGVKYENLNKFENAFECYNTILKFISPVIHNNGIDSFTIQDVLHILIKLLMTHKRAFPTNQNNIGAILQLERLSMVELTSQYTQLELIKSLEEIGNLLVDKTLYREALHFLHTKLRIERTLYQDPHQIVNATQHKIATILLEIGSISIENGHVNSGLESYNESITILKNIYSNDYIDAIKAADRIANILERKSFFTEAIEIYYHCLDMQAIDTGHTHPKYAEILIKIGKNYQQKSDWDQALEAYNEALMIVKFSLGESHTILIPILEEISGIYLKLGETGRAGMELNEARRIRENTSTSPVHGVQFQNQLLMNFSIFCRDTDDRTASAA